MYRISLLALILLGAFATPAFAQYDDEVRCSSHDYQYRYCKVKIRGDVRLLRRLSDAACERGRSWGNDRRGIWVDRGCSAVFVVGSGRPQHGGPVVGHAGGGISGGGGGDYDMVTCESNDSRRRYCRVDTGGRVRLQRQLSRADCVQGHTWGYDRRGIWVDQGCRGRFRVERRAAYEQSENISAGRKVTCRSRNYRYHFCRVETGGRVELIRRISDAPCTQGRTWGYDHRGIWVDQGCSARFAVRALGSHDRN